METPVRVIALQGFDPEGEPEIRVMPDGALYLVVNFMPPSDAVPEEDALFEHFDEELAKAIGVEVAWEDRELFLIRAPNEHTITDLKRFIKSCRREARCASATGSEKPLRLVLIEELGKALTPTGFRYQKTTGEFARRIPAGKQAVYAEGTTHGGQYVFDPAVFIRLDAVEALVYPDKPKERRQMPTIVTNLEHFGLHGERPFGVHWRIVSREDVLSAVATLRPVLEEKVLPFLDRHRDVVSLDQALHPTNTASDGAATPGAPRRGGLHAALARLAPRKADAAPEDPWEPWRQERRALDSGSQPWRAMVRLAIAHLAGNPRFEELAEAYTREVHALDLLPNNQQQFDDLLTRLRLARSTG